MQETQATAEDPLLEGYHHIRTLTDRDAPWPGRLARLPDGRSCVLVDVGVLGHGWAGWSADPDGHVVTPVDLVRRRGGHDAAMPVCLERVDAFLSRRCGEGDAAARAAVQHPRDALDDGETVTLAVSLLRGAAEAARLPGESAGDWWLTEAGRPALALTRARGASAAELLRLVASCASVRLSSLVHEAADVAADVRVVVRELDRLEGALFGAAEPKPLAVHGHAMLATREVVARPVQIEPAAGRSMRWIDALARHVDVDLSALTSDTLDRMRRRLVRRRVAESPPPPREGSAGSRRRPWLLAAAIAGGLLGVGMLWPSGGGPATADEPAGTPSTAMSSATVSAPGAVAASTPAPGDAAESTVAVDWATGTADLLARRVACGSDTACLAGILEDTTRSIPSGAVDASDREVVLLDEFGGVAVLRVQSPTSASAQLALVVRADGRLLLREVHDIAEQKG